MTKTPHTPDDAPKDAGPQSETMRNADTANGENSDSGEPEPSDAQRTGVAQARENAENDPPA